MCVTMQLCVWEGQPSGGGQLCVWGGKPSGEGKLCGGQLCVCVGGVSHVGGCWEVHDDDTYMTP